MDNSYKNSLSPRIHADFHGFFLRSAKIRANPWPGFLRSAPGKRQQSNVSRLLDRGRQTPLVRGADSGEASRNDLATLGHELRQQPDVFVVDGFNFLHAEFADLLAAKIFTPTFAATRAAWTRRTALTSIGSRRTVSTGRAVSYRTAVRCCSDLFSHDAP
jgi:hypothetical protein